MATQKTTVQLTGEERTRMAQLYKEINEHLKEMAKIGVDHLSKADSAFASVVKGKEPVLMFSPKRSAASGAKEVVELKGIEITCYGSGEGMCMCYDHDAGVCSVC